jgi:acrylyl-CoA reductase (NADPH)
MTFRALLTNQVDKTLSHEVVELDDSRLPDGDVTIAVDYSSLNYKDGLVLTGRGRLVKDFPHVGGIDLAGTVTESSSMRWNAGQRVLVTGFRVGEIWWGGYASKARVKSDWVCEVPAEITTRQAMAIGTAGFTAMLALDQLERAGMRPGQGPVLVTGASGGVGSTAVHLLARLGYEVVASTGRATERRAELVRFGASEVIERDSIADIPERPLLSERWAGVVYAVGGSTLSHVLAELKYGAGVAACGLAGGDKITSTVIPFLLRGNNLFGIDSVLRPLEGRQEVWQRAASTMDLSMLDAMTTEIGLGDLPAAAETILQGQVAGRWVVNASR